MNGLRAFKEKKKSDSEIISGITLTKDQINNVKKIASHIPGIREIYFNKYASGYLTFLYEDSKRARHIHWFEFCVRYKDFINSLNIKILEPFKTIIKDE